MNKPIISCIIPVYGVEKYIERFARSLFEQTLTENVEFIFVNDCTPDNSIIVLQNTIEKYPKIEEQVKIINNPVNSGQSPSRNNGIKASKGEYIICLDSDDWVEPTMLEDMYNKAITENCDVVIADFFVNVGKKENVISQKPEKLDGLSCANQILNSTLHGSWCNKLFKRNLVINYNIIMPQLGMKFKEDLMVTTQLLFHSNKVGYVDKAYYHYFYNINSISNKRNITVKVIDQQLYVISFIEDLFKINKIKNEESVKSLNYLKTSVLAGVSYDASITNTKFDFWQYRNLFPYIWKHRGVSMFFKLSLVFSILKVRPLVKLLSIIKTFRLRNKQH